MGCTSEPSLNRLCGGGLALPAGAPNVLDRDRRDARLLSNRAILVLDDRARGGIAVETAQHLARYLAVRPLGAIFVKDVEQHEFGACPGFSSHFCAPVLNGPDTVGKLKTRRDCAGPRSQRRYSSFSP